MKRKPDKKYLTTSEAAELCEVSRFTVLNWVKEGKLPAVKTTGGHNRIAISELKNFMRERGLDLSLLLAKHPTTFDCWEFFSSRHSGEDCRECLVYKEKIYPCFLSPKKSSSEEILCKEVCFDCSYFKKHFKGKKDKIKKLLEMWKMLNAAGKKTKDKKRDGKKVHDRFYKIGKYLHIAQVELKKLIQK